MPWYHFDVGQQFSYSRREAIMLRSIFIWGLSALLVVQLVWGTSKISTHFVETVPIEVGSELPFALLGNTQATKMLAENGASCSSAFICTTRCPFCSRLAEKYSKQVEDNRPDHSPILWLLADEPASAEAWAEEHGLATSNVYTLAPKQARWFQRPKYGNITITPTRVILTSEAVVRDVRPSDEVPDEQSLFLICKNYLGTM